jgi:SAM-dependent methyltransferase
MNALEPKSVVDLSDFSEAEYLALNPDVARAVAHGQFKSGRHHFEQFGKAEGRALRRTSMQKIIGDTPIFSSDYPHQQNALNLFEKTWVAGMPEGSGLTAGTLAHMTGARVQWAANVIGSLAGKTILELGPFEGYDAYTFERLGATAVVSIENNVTNFLKCLVIKNIFDLRTTFLLGDFVRFLENDKSRFDVCWMSGVLYHMTDPIRLMRAASRVSDILFIWTHYYDHLVINADTEKKAPFRPNFNKTVEFADRQIVLHYRSYGGRKGNDFSGGHEEHSFWLLKDDIMHVLSSLGYNRIVVGHDEPGHVHGSSCSIVAFR